ncbi:hypothetical protein [Bacillus sp. 1P06AnD]|uniref:hypothetical protein n=1 Tax=Bacillus sp. 1P06AnD TaxID=3132208 RepID=UPI0039A08A0C
MKKKKLSILLAAIFLLVGCSKTENGLSGAKPPDVLISAESGRLKSTLGTYCWSSKGRGVCADTAGPYELLKDKKPLAVEPNERVSIEMDFEPKPDEIHFTKMVEENKEEELKLENGQTFQAPGQKGIYTYVYSVWWMDNKHKNTSLGDAFYTFKLEVE